MDIHLMDPSLHDDSAIHKTQKNVHNEQSVPISDVHCTS